MDFTKTGFAPVFFTLMGGITAIPRLGWLVILSSG